MSAQCVHAISVVPRISWTNVAPSSKHDPICPMSFQSKSSVCFTIPFVPCRLSVFIPSRWYHASRGQTWHPRASTTQSVPCLFSQSLLCVSRSHLCHVGSVCSSHLGGTTHLVDKRGALEQARPNVCHVFSVKVLRVFLLTLEQARSHLCHVGSVCSCHLGGTTHLVSQSLLCVSRSHLCHVGSVCSSHLGGTTHLVDKRGALEQAWPNLRHVFFVKVFCVFLLTLERVRSHFLPFQFGQSVVCFSKLSSKQDPICAMLVHCVPLSV